MRILGIETSTMGGEVAAGDEGGFRAVRRLDPARRHTRDLAPSMEAVCSTAGWRLRDVELILVDVGPGSYTGLRVGLMAAKTLAYVSNAKLIAVDVARILFESAPASAAIVHAIIDAQQGNIHVARLNRSSSPGIEEAIRFEFAAFADWASTLKSNDYVTGPALDRFAADMPAGIHFADLASRHPGVEALRSVGLRFAAAGKFTDAWTVEPLYLRPSSAQLKWDARLQTAQDVAATTPIAKPS